MTGAWGDAAKDYISSAVTGEMTITLDADGVRKLDEINAWLRDPDPNAKRPEWMLRFQDYPIEVLERVHPLAVEADQYPNTRSKHDHRR